MTGKVSFPGVTRKPHEKMRESVLFVLSSQFEGFPNVLCEAVAELAVTLEKVMKDAGLRASLGKNASEITRRFSIHKVARMWEELFFEYSKNDQGNILLY